MSLEQEKLAVLKQIHEEAVKQTALLKEIRDALKPPTEIVSIPSQFYGTVSAGPTLVNPEECDLPTFNIVGNPHPWAVPSTIPDFNQWLGAMTGLNKDDCDQPITVNKGEKA